MRVCFPPRRSTSPAAYVSDAVPAVHLVALVVVARVAADFVFDLRGTALSAQETLISLGNLALSPTTPSPTFSPTPCSTPVPVSPGRGARRRRLPPPPTPSSASRSAQSPRLKVSRRQPAAIFAIVDAPVDAPAERPEQCPSS